jgi:hypothetical protein
MTVTSIREDVKHEGPTGLPRELLVEGNVYEVVKSDTPSFVGSLVFVAMGVVHILYNNVNSSAIKPLKSSGSSNSNARFVEVDVEIRVKVLS